MLWLRGAAFTVLGPGVIAGLVPRLILGPAPLGGGFWRIGWLILAAAVEIYLWCLGVFLAAAGTPAIFFTRPLRSVIGEEPRSLVRRGLYRFSRNPMYVGVVLAVAGQAVLHASAALAAYAVLLFACFHAVVVLLEEPHLRARDPEEFERYTRKVRRWL
jgi:protein-S-isoprenylcysteine O-methyltransferase Ste14